MLRRVGEQNRQEAFPDVAGQLFCREVEAICQHPSRTQNESKNI